MQIKEESVKERMKSSAYKVFLEKGYIGASLEAISERASISKGNIYRHYKNKDHLYSSLVEPAMAFIVDSMEISKRTMSFYKSLKKNIRNWMGIFLLCSYTAWRRHTSTLLKKWFITIPMMMN